jgi:gliding motility-associated-like protein
MIFEADYESALYGENNALFGYDVRFSPGIPTDYSCANLEFISQDEGGTNSILGGDPSALIAAQCLEPGYKYFGMIDPSNNVTPLSSQQISAWLYDPSVVDPSSNPPGNDILCLTMADPLYEIPVTPAGTNPNFQAVAGDNVFACREYLAGEPAADPNAANRADQTVWHYFIAPPSGAVEMNIRAYIGLNQLRYNVYQLLNGTDCYGGLNPATYTEDGTRNTPIITPVLSGVAGFSGTQESLCCLVPGTIYAVQLDGGSPGDEGQYIIEYIREVAADAGDIYVELDNGSIIEVTQPDTAFVCFGETIIPGIMLNGIGQTTLDIPSCLQLGYVIHNIDPIPDPVANTGFTFIDSVQTATGTFVNDTDGSGTFGNPLFNQVYFVSPMADEPANWGDLTCVSSTVEEGVPVVFLQPVVPSSSYNSALCEITFSAVGGLAAFNSSTFSYTIQNAAMNTVAVGTFANGGTVVYPVPSAEVYTITVTDGACPYTFTIDASACSNPCLTNPNINFVNATICNGETIFLEGANQTTAGLYTDVFTAANGCDSTIYTTVTVIEPVTFAQTFTICQGSSVTVGANTYNTSGIYTDILTAANGCDSTVTTTLFVESVLTSNYSMTICDGDSYVFEGTTVTTTGTYNATLTAVGGCDSIVTLFLTVRPPNGSTINAAICQGQSYTFGASSYSTAGTYTNVLTDVNGCDSTVTLNLTVNPVLTGSTAATICSGQNYTFGTQTLSSSGTYTEPFTTAAGCDSIVTLYLTVLPALNSSQSVSICQGQTYSFGTQNLTAAGTYTQTVQNAAGCDSIVTLYLNVLPALSSSQSATICQGQSYTFGTQTLTASGTYTETVQTTSGCDSTVTLYLFVTEPAEFYTDSTICEGSTMVFGTQTLGVSGIYTEQFTSAAGCDSLVYLELSVTDCAADFEISNIVTPNDDGQNDTWKISDPTQVAGCTVTIYNRWGQPVYESTDYQNEWGGTKDGEPLPDGVYFYSIICSDTEYTGEVNLFRFKK